MSHGPDMIHMILDHRPYVSPDIVSLDYRHSNCRLACLHGDTPWHRHHGSRHGTCHVRQWWVILTQYIITAHLMKREYKSYLFKRSFLKKI